MFADQGQGSLGTFILIPIKSRVACGFNPTNGSRNKYVFREMDVYPVGCRIYGNWTECVSAASHGHFPPECCREVTICLPMTSSSSSGGSMLRLVPAISPVQSGLPCGDWVRKVASAAVSTCTLGSWAIR
ncbi:hypothetical protein ACVWZX_003649 [Deinococcus sp. UYEF24]